MDQSISIMGVANSALLIDFYPKLNATLVQLPKVTPSPVFVIANTLVTSDKHVTAPIHFNLRVVETRLGSALLAKKLKTGLKGRTTFKKIQESLLGLEIDYAHDLQKMIDHIDAQFKKTPYNLQEIATELEITVDELKETFMKSIEVRADNGFDLYKRAVHVYGEAQRVYKFQELCEKNATLKELGDLMNESHYSCRDLFECSCKELDELTQICRDQGAYGSRLTGAGWGGCSVSLVAEDKVEAFIKNVKELYYAKFTKTNAELDLDECIFATYPGSGAGVITDLMAGPKKFPSDFLKKIYRFLGLC
jgi:galactokinase